MFILNETSFYKTPFNSKLSCKEEALGFILASHHYMIGGFLRWMCLAADMREHVHPEGSYCLVLILDIIRCDNGVSQEPIM